MNTIFRTSSPTTFAKQGPSRRAILRDASLLAIGLAMPIPALAQQPPLNGLLAQAERLASLQTVIVARNGEILAQRGFRGHTLSAPTNIKSASKAVIAALVGMAIDRGILQGTDQPVAPILRDDLPADRDPRIEQITIGDLLTMRAGLRPTSGPEYGRWVASRNWVRAALAQPFDDDPGGRMLYSTGSSHLLSAVLTRVTGRSTLRLARDWMSDVDGFAIAGWQRDPQGIYLGGNEMAMSPRSLLAFGELFRTGGTAPDGARVLSRDWVARSWAMHTTSRWSGDGYGYGWFLRSMAGEPVSFAWGYGGQMLYVAPRSGLTVAMTSDSTPRPGTIADRDNLHALMTDIIREARPE